MLLLFSKAPLSRGKQAALRTAPVSVAISVERSPEAIWWTELLHIMCGEPKFYFVKKSNLSDSAQKMILGRTEVFLSRSAYRFVSSWGSWTCNRNAEPE